METASSFLFQEVSSITKGLTQKQRRFIDEYIISGNATQAGRKFETPHIHVGYEHQGSYVRNLNFWEKRLLSRTKNIWYNKRKDK